MEAGKANKQKLNFEFKKKIWNRLRLYFILITTQQTARYIYWKKMCCNV